MLDFENFKLAFTSLSAINIMYPGGVGSPGAACEQILFLFKLDLVSAAVSQAYTNSPIFVEEGILL